MSEMRHAGSDLTNEFERIKAANATIMTTDIKGKSYAQVNERVKAFRMVHPLGKIETEIISLSDGICTMIARVYADNEHLLATGHAQEKESSSFINKTSYIENCETSAIGRALGMCGFGIDTSICSAEELQNALNNQGAGKQSDTMEFFKIALKMRQKLTDSMSQIGEDIHSDKNAEYIRKTAKTNTDDPAVLASTGDADGLQRLIKTYEKMQKGTEKRIGEKMISDSAPTF